MMYKTLLHIGMSVTNSSDNALTCSIRQSWLGKQRAMAGLLKSTRDHSLLGTKCNSRQKGDPENPSPEV